MALDFCKNHPGQKATCHCETCHIPLCEKCAIHIEGHKQAFCTDAHAQNYVAYLAMSGGKTPKRFKRPSFIVNLIAWAGAIFVTAAIAHYMKWMPPALDKYLGFLP